MPDDDYQHNHDLIASRTLNQGDTNDESLITVSIFRPYRHDAEWRCTFTIQVGQEQHRNTSFGEDSLQAIILALDGIKSFLEKKYPKARWLDFEHGNMGLPLMVHAGPIPWRRFSTLQDEIQQMVENEISDFVARKSIEKGHQA